jgi:transposase-like protein
MEAINRQQKALEMLEHKYTIKRIDSSTYKVRSQSVKNRFYCVRIDHNNNYTCECADFAFRGKPLMQDGIVVREATDCKHILSVKAYRQLVQKEQKATIGKERPTHCPKCGHNRMHGDGIRKVKQGLKQRWKCPKCSYKCVTNEEGFERTSYDPKVITEALNLRFSGLSLRKTVRHLTMTYNLDSEIHHTTLLKWTNKYMVLIKSHVDKLVPRLSQVWHADELMLNVKNTKPMKGKGRYVWLWNLMSSEEKFLIASVISKEREVSDARRLFAEGKALAQRNPKEIITDSLTSYPQAFTKEFYTNTLPRPIHTKYPSIERNPNNNKIERLHNTQREKLKVMRGVDNDKSAQAYADADRTNYNFNRPHMGLDGKTPAEAAGINLGLGKNKLRDLIKQSAVANKLKPEEKFKVALGKRLERVEVIDERDCIKVKPKTWLGKEQWKEINNILRTFDFAWVSNGRDSLWLKPLN